MFLSSSYRNSGIPPPSLLLQAHARSAECLPSQDHGCRPSCRVVPRRQDHSIAAILVRLSVLLQGAARGSRQRESCAGHGEAPAISREEVDRGSGSRALGGRRMGSAWRDTGTLRGRACLRRPCRGGLRPAELQGRASRGGARGSGFPSAARPGWATPRDGSLPAPSLQEDHQGAKLGSAGGCGVGVARLVVVFCGRLVQCGRCARP